ncbi:MAG: GntR family transcriptional regulator [Lentisphaeria bacterium]|nr:GntR family transcriptional regulator [Lentisphaeria bacterium]
MISLSKLEIVRRHLQEELAGGNYKPGAPFLSENELARRLGICKNTVREAMSGLVAEGRLVRKRGLGTFVSNAPPTREEGAPKVLNLIIGDYLEFGGSATFVTSVLAGLHAELDPRNYQILVECVPDTDRGADQLKHLPAAGRSSAIVLGGFDFSRELIEKIHESGTPAVTIGKPEIELLPYVHTDHRSGMRRATEYLLKNGHRRIAMIDSPTYHATSYIDRQEGFLQAMEEAGTVPDARLMVNSDGHGPEAAAEACRKLLARNADFSAVIVYGATESLGFLREFERTGKRIPEDVSLLEYASSAAMLPGLTTAYWNLFDLARAAARRLLGESPETPSMLPVRLCEGSSVIPYKMAEAVECQ